MRQCLCGSKSFKVETVIEATDYVELLEDGQDDVNIYDTRSYDSTWRDKAKVECQECGRETTYGKWRAGARLRYRRGGKP